MTKLDGRWIAPGSPEYMWLLERGVFGPVKQETRLEAHERRSMQLDEQEVELRYQAMPLDPDSLR